MTFESRLRSDILPEEYTEPRKRIIVESESPYNMILREAMRVGKSRTPRPAKNITESLETIKLAIEDYHEREMVDQDAQIYVTYEDPDTDSQLEAITMSLAERLPGSFSQGSPGEGRTKNLKPLYREEEEDSDNPGYKRVILGYFYDNWIELTCWARTNKSANSRVLWLENVMEEYQWLFKLSGINRVLYQGRGKDQFKQVNNNKFYGRISRYYIRTEQLRCYSEKTLEQIYVKFNIGAF